MRGEWKLEVGKRSKGGDEMRGLHRDFWKVFGYDFL
jgi:hypothetical protein